MRKIMFSLIVLLLVSTVMAQPTTNLIRGNFTQNVTYGEDFTYWGFIEGTVQVPPVAGEQCTFFVIDDHQHVEVLFPYFTAVDTAASNKEGFSFLTGNNGTIFFQFSTIGLEVGRPYTVELYCGETTSLSADMVDFTVNYEVFGEFAGDMMTFLLANIGLVAFSFILAIFVVAAFILIAVIFRFFPNMWRAFK